MAGDLHPQAPHDLPGFLPGPDGSDPLMTFVIILVLVIVLLVGVGYFALHALPERMAHKSNSTQFQLIGILALLALFTHNHIFWIAALLLAAVRLPDVMTPLNRIAASLEAASGTRKDE